MGANIATKELAYPILDSIGLMSFTSFSFEMMCFCQYGEGVNGFGKDVSGLVSLY